MSGRIFDIIKTLWEQIPPWEEDMLYGRAYKHSTLVRGKKLPLFASDREAEPSIYLLTNF